MKRTPILSGLGLAAAATTLLVFGASSNPAPTGGMVEFDVTVTNLTHGQIFAPVLLATHDRTISVFTPGQPASPELATLAEEGDTSLLAGLLVNTAGVADVGLGTGMIPPGGSETIRISASGAAHRLSMASMLVSTNDTFAGLESIVLPRGKGSMNFALGYDAGSEFNSESCAYIPGPPCGSAGMHDPTTPEGFVHISNGVQGHGDVDPVNYDWRNPVARVEIRRAD